VARGGTGRRPRKFPIKNSRAIGTILRGAELRFCSGVRGRKMATAEQCRYYAAECVRLARNSDSPVEKGLLLQMAERWRELAERAEKEAKKI